MKHRKNSVWLTTGEAVERLGVSNQLLHSLKDSGAFRLGTHYRVISKPAATCLTYQWHIANLEKYFKIPPEKR